MMTSRRSCQKWNIFTLVQTIFFRYAEYTKELKQRSQLDSLESSS